jgi:hypothetical protein
MVQLEGIPLSYRDLTRSILPDEGPELPARAAGRAGRRGLAGLGRPLSAPERRRPDPALRRERVDRLLIPPQVDPLPEGLTERHQAILDHLSRRGASFHAELAALSPDLPGDRLLTLLWDLVWAGLITNDTFGALRTLAARGRDRRPGRPPASGRHRSWRPGSRSAGGGPTGGRWSLVRDLVREPVSPTERAAAWASALLDRHGIVFRETAAQEALGGGFSAVYQVFRSLEEAGKVRRGYFVEGLGGPSSPTPGSSIGSGVSATAMTKTTRSSWPPRTRPIPTAGCCHGRTSAAPGGRRPGLRARRWCWSPANPSFSWTAGAGACGRSRRRHQTTRARATARRIPAGHPTRRPWLARSRCCARSPGPTPAAPFPWRRWTGSPPSGPPSGRCWTPPGSSRTTATSA